MQTQKGVLLMPLQRVSASGARRRRAMHIIPLVSGGARVQLIIERLHAAGELQDLRLRLWGIRHTHTMNFSLQST